MDVDPFCDTKTVLSQLNALELCRECALSSLDYQIASEYDLSKCPESPIAQDIDSEDSDPCNDDYVAGEYESCLQEIESAIYKRVSLQERSRMYLGRLQNLYSYMLLPVKKFDSVDNALGELLMCACNGQALSDPPLFLSCERELVQELHTNKFVRKLHVRCKLAMSCDT
jgi:hypothetical protein